MSKEEVYGDELKASFYKNLRINFLAKFHTQNVQSLKNHVKSSLIEKMPDIFSPLEKSDLTFARKFKKGDVEKEKDQFLKWFNREMSDHRPTNKFYNQNKKLYGN